MQSGPPDRAGRRRRPRRRCDRLSTRIESQPSL